MPTPTVDFKVLADGYSLEGGEGEPLRATVPYLVAWEDAFDFFDQVLGYPTAGTTLGAGQTLGYRFPPQPKLVALKARIEPCGTGGETGTMLGLAPGEYWTHAKVTVNFETPRYSQESSDDPGGANQLDPANPITFCEQSVDIGGRAETIKAEGYEFDDGKPVTGDLIQIVSETKLVLTFPRVPFLPWGLVRPYVGRVNLNEILLCPAGTLLLEGMGTKFAHTSQGVQSQQLQLMFASQEYDWNMIPKPNGVPALVRRKGDTSRRIYEYKDFAEIFA